jgi:hypothetical protein
MPRVRPAALVAVAAVAAALLSGCTDDPGTPARPGGSAGAASASGAPTASAGPAVATDMLEKAVVKSLAHALHMQAILQVSGRTLTIDTDTDRSRPTNTLALR